MFLSRLLVLHAISEGQNECSEAVKLTTRPLDKHFTCALKEEIEGLRLLIHTPFLLQLLIFHAHSGGQDGSSEAVKLITRPIHIRKHSIYDMKEETE